MKLSRILCIDGAHALMDDYLVGLVDVGGFTTRFCWTREQALLNAPDMRPDLILLAGEVGNASAADILEELRRIEPISRVPILAVVPDKESFERLSGEFPAVVGWIRRPFDPMDLAELVRVAWDRLSETEYFS